MKSSVKKQKDGKVRLVVEIEPEVVETRYREVLKDFQRQARLPGFREGKAPIELVEKKYSKEAEKELLKTLIPEAYHRTIREKNISPVTLPSISDIKLERGKKLSFAAEFEETPEVPVRNYKGIRLRRVSTEVSDADVVRALDGLLDAHAELIPLAEPRAAREGDFVSVDVEPWEKGAWSAVRKGVLLQVDRTGEDDFLEKIVGAAVGDAREITRPAKPGDVDTEGRACPPDGRAPYARVHVREIKEKRLPAADDEFAKRFGKDTLAALRDALRKELSSRKHAESMQTMKAELFQKLTAMVSFAPPAGLVERQRERLEERVRREGERAGLKPDAVVSEVERQKGAMRDEAARQVKIYFILRKIAQLEDVDVDEIDLQKRLEALARDSQRPMEEVRGVLEEDLRRSMREQKTVDFLIAHAKLDEDGK